MLLEATCLSLGELCPLIRREGWLVRQVSATSSLSPSCRLFGGHLLGHLSSEILQRVRRGNFSPSRNRRLLRVWNHSPRTIRAIESITLRQTWPPSRPSFSVPSLVWVISVSNSGLYQARKLVQTEIKTWKKSEKCRGFFGSHPSWFKPRRSGFKPRRSGLP